jgi:hypothetical protein
VAPLTFGQIELPDDVIAPVDAPDDGPDERPIDAPDDGPDARPDVERLEPVAIDVRPETGDAGEVARWAAPATATPPVSNVAARTTVASADHHSRVPGLSLFQRPPSRSIVPVIMPLLFCLPGGHCFEDRPRR